MAWLQNRFMLKQKNHHSAARYQAWQHDEGEEEAIKRMAEKKKHIGRFKLFLHKRINTVHEF